MAKRRKAKRTRRGQLVTEYIESISRKALEEYQSLIRDFVRGRNGIYALYRKNRLDYVGLARDLRSRLKQHLKDRHGQSWDRFSAYLTPGDTHIKELESLVIRIGKPPGNKVRGGFTRAVNLRRAFKRRVKEDSKRRLDELLGTTIRTEVRSKSGGGLRQPVLARLAGRVRRLRAKYKGKTYNARVLRTGVVSFAGHRYGSPSLAGKAVINRACNGWHFWKYERTRGEWVKLNELRRR